MQTSHKRRSDDDDDEEIQEKKKFSEEKEGERESCDCSDEAKKGSSDEWRE